MHNRINAWYPKKQFTKKKANFAHLTEAQRQLYWENLKKLSEKVEEMPIEGIKEDCG